LIASELSETSGPYVAAHCIYELSKKNLFLLPDSKKLLVHLDEFVIFKSKRDETILYFTLETGILQSRTLYSGKDSIFGALLQKNKFVCLFT